MRIAVAEACATLRNAITDTDAKEWDLPFAAVVASRVIALADAAVWPVPGGPTTHCERALAALPTSEMLPLMACVLYLDQPVVQKLIARRIAALLDGCKTPAVVRDIFGIDADLPREVEEEAVAQPLYGDAPSDQDKAPPASPPRPPLSRSLSAQLGTEEACEASLLFCSLATMRVLKARTSRRAQTGRAD